MPNTRVRATRMRVVSGPTLTWLTPLPRTCVGRTVPLLVVAGPAGTARTARFFDGKRQIRVLRRNTAGLYGDDVAEPRSCGLHTLRAVVQIGESARGARRPLAGAVVTGGSSGIGAAVARLLAEKGWHCVLVARNEERLAAVAEEIGGEYEVCDVGDREAVERMAAELRGRHPAVKLLVNNAGISSGEGLRRDGPGVDRAAHPTQLLGAVWCLRGFRRRWRQTSLLMSSTWRQPQARSPSCLGLGDGTPSWSSAAAAPLPAQGVHVHTVTGFVETPGFPQRGRLGGRLLERTIVSPEYAARRIVSAVERNRPEIFVPGWYRVPAVAQALAPGLISRLLARRG
jgi:short-subunit dehydrogenase